MYHHKKTDVHLQNIDRDPIDLEMNSITQMLIKKFEPTFGKTK